MHMTIPYFHVCSFTSEIFKGNPTGICPLEKWIEDEKMQKIAAENNLSETAFFVKENDYFKIRYFSPIVEIDLCGHATLASALVLYHMYEYKNMDIQFLSNAGKLKIRKSNDLIIMNFPSYELSEIKLPEILLKGLNILPREVYEANEDYMLVYKTEDEIIKLQPEFSELKKSKSRGIIVTAPGKEYDFVSRFFAPQVGIHEDPVTGSAHCAMSPYWSKKLNKRKLRAKQLSKRTGEIGCYYLGDRTEISGNAVFYMMGEISL
ncbi:PhzF family phenazine biosynthesis protein [Bacteroidota bacterium]